MEEFDYYSINDFSTLIQLLTGFAVVFAGYNNFVYSYRRRFTTFSKNFVINLKKEQVGIVNIYENLSGYLKENDEVKKIYTEFVDSCHEVERNTYLIFDTDSESVAERKKKKRKKLLVQHFEKYASVAKPALSYTSIYGIIILVFIGLTQHDVQYLLSDGFVISSKRAFYKLLFIFSILSTIYIFFSLLFSKNLINNPDSANNKKFKKKNDNVSYFTQSIIWAGSFLILSFLLLLYLYSEKYSLMEKVPSFLIIHFQPIASFYSFFIVLLGYPLLYISTFSRYKMHILVENDLFNHKVRFVTNEFMKLIMVSNGNTDDTNGNQLINNIYQSPMKTPIYFKFFMKTYAIRLVVMSVCLICIPLLYSFTPVSYLSTFRNIIDESNENRLNIFKNYEKLSNDSRDKILSKHYIKSGQAYNDVINIVNDREAKGYHFDTLQPPPFIKEFKISYRDENHIVINTLEQWNTHWYSNENKDLWYVGDNTAYQTYVLKKIGAVWKLESIHYAGTTKEDIN